LSGTVIIFYIVKWLGKDLINKIFQSEKINKFKFLNNNKNLEFLVGVLFFIPGTPKDILTYFVPLTKIKPSRFFVISTIAKIPSIITSTYGGATLQEGNFLKALIIFAITGVIGIGGILIHNKLVNKHNKSEKTDNKSKV
ncbi:MAG: VTT domain-containing protein, partial [Clostridia bacterium]